MRPPLAAPAKPATIERFLHDVDPREPLLRLFDEDVPFYIGDVTEAERPYAKRTRHVSRLSNPA
jgi:hypothetical protein